MRQRSRERLMGSAIAREIIDHPAKGDHGCGLQGLMFVLRGVHSLLTSVLSSQSEQYFQLTHAGLARMDGAPKGGPM